MMEIEEEWKKIASNSSTIRRELMLSHPAYRFYYFTSRQDGTKGRSMILQYEDSGDMTVYCFSIGRRRYNIYASQLTEWKEEEIDNSRNENGEMVPGVTS